MADPGAAPVAVTLPEVYRLYRQTLARCWLPAGLLALAYAAFSAQLTRWVGDQDDLLVLYERLQELLHSGAFWRLLLAMAALTLLAFLAMTAAIHAQATARPPPAAGGLLLALRLLPAAAVAAMLFVVLTSLASILIVPGAWLFGWWQLWIAPMVVERCGPLAALRRSGELVRGAWWHVTTQVTLVSLAVLLLPLIGDAVLGVLGSSTLSIAGDVIITALSLPLLPAAMVALYLGRTRDAVTVRQPPRAS